MSERLARDGVERPEQRLGAAHGSGVPGPSHPAPSLEHGDGLQRPEQRRVPHTEAGCRAFTTRPQATTTIF